MELDEELMAITSEGIIIRTPIGSISQIGRNTQGVKVMRVSNQEKVVSIVCVKQNLDDLVDDEFDEDGNEIIENAEIVVEETITEE